MKITDFINGYKQLSSEALKEKYIKSVLKIQYVPYEEKIKYAKRCLREHFNEEGMIYQNTPMAYLRFVMCVLYLYTSLETDNSSDVQIYNNLQAHGLAEQIMTQLSDMPDFKEFKTIYGMCLADFETNTLSPRGFIQLQVAKLGDNAHALAEYLSKLDEKTFLERFKKK